MTQVVCIIASLVCLLFVLRCVSRGSLSLRYSLLWIVIAAVTILFSVFPGLSEVLADFAGFELPSNLIFASAILFLGLISITLTIAISKLEEKNKDLAQRMALIEYKNRDKN